MDLNRNIVIEASAGTGKTYTLVQTILQALFEKNLPMDSVVALTFTKKAAGEMKERIAAELKKIDQAKTMEDAWIRRGHTLQELKGRAREALETIDRAAIGTIHSYGFSLLKRFPLAAGISPDAEVDDKNVRGDDLFEKEWSKWLRSELREQGSGGAGERAKEWLEILEQVKLSEVSDLARRLCDFDVPLESLLLSKGAEGTGEQGGDQIIATLARLIKPFVAKFRARILADGYLSNNALLVLARELVASDFKVREILKREIR